MIKLIKKCKRVIYICYILIKYNIIDIIKPIYKYKFYKMCFIFTYFFNKKNKKLSEGYRLRVALEQLGPIFIKIGQILSTRHDLLPMHLINELEKLQNKVKIINNSHAISIIEESLNNPINKLFLKFNTTPLTSGSMAEIYSATLKTGEDVIVKVIKQNIKNILDEDIKIIINLSKILECCLPSIKRLRILDIINEIGNTLYNEIDLEREAANASQMKRNFKNSKIHYIPKIYWKFSRYNCLTLERINAIPISNIKKLKFLGTNFKLLAERGIEIFYTQVFRDCFFHADMHPGNVFVDVNNPNNPKYISIDFGIIGTLNEEDKHYLSNNFLAFFNRDYKSVAELHIESGWVSSNIRVDELESAIRAICEPMFEQPLMDISFGYTLMRLFKIAKTFNIKIQPQLILLQKTLFNIEASSRKLYPNLNLWIISKPFLEKWARSKFNWTKWIKMSMNNFPQCNKNFIEIPNLLFKVLKKNLDHKEQIYINQKKISFINIITIIFIIVYCYEHLFLHHSI